MYTTCVWAETATCVWVLRMSSIVWVCVYVPLVAEYEGKGKLLQLVIAIDKVIDRFMLL